MRGIARASPHRQGSRMIPISDRNPTRNFPLVNLLLISINIIVFLLELTMRTRVLDQFIMSWGAVPKNIWFAIAQPLQTPPTVWVTLVTSQFLHGGWAHIVGNMLYLWVFGDNIEEILGSFTYLFFYLASGIAAAMTHVIVEGPSPIPTIGASGAIAGVLGAYLLLYPTKSVSILIPLFFFFWTIDLPALVVIGWWFVQQFFYGVAALSSTAASGIAYWAHIGGFGAGLILILPFLGRARRRRQPYYYNSDDWS
jgi:membrane associated rhomboid family serine protease